MGLWDKVKAAVSSVDTFFNIAPAAKKAEYSAAVPRQLKNAVIIRKNPSYSIGSNHVQNGRDMPIKPNVVQFLGMSGTAWCKISYTYEGKNYIGFIPDGNLLPPTRGNLYGGRERTESTSSNIVRQTTTTVSRSLDGDRGEQVLADAAQAVTKTSSVIPAIISEFTNPENSLGANYADFSPDPDPNAEHELVSSKQHYEEPFNIFVLPGFTPARMVIYTYENRKQVARSFEFLVSPSNMTESNANSIVPMRTGAGHFLLRNGSELGRLNISGYLMETDAVDERRIFMENYYRSYMIDKVNTFHSYFNESILFIELEGYRYRCVLQNLDLAKAANSMFLFRYSMNLIVLSQDPIGSLGVSRYTDRASRNKANARAELVFNADAMLGRASNLYDSYVY